MPALRTKQYLVASPAAGPSTSPGPMVPNRATLRFQNTGANPGLFRFGGATRGDGSDLTVAAGATVSYDQDASTCPKESLNFSSVAGTTWAVIEGVLV